MTDPKRSLEGRSRIGSGFGTGAPTMRLARPAGSQRGFSWTPQSLVQVAFDLGGDEEIRRPYEQNPWVHAAVKVLAEAAASVRLRLWVSDQDDAAEVGETDALTRLFNRPNPLMSGATLFAAAMIHRKLDGEDFWFLTDAGGAPLKVSDAGKIEVPAQVWPVRGTTVEAVTEKQRVGVNGSARDIKRQIGWRYTTADGIKSETWPLGAVIHFRDYDPSNMKRGIGDVEVLARALTLQFQAERYQEGLLRNSGDPGGFVKYKERLVEGERDRLEQEVNAEFGNPANRGDWKVIDDGAEYIPNSIKPKDMEFHTLLTHTRDTILAVLGVPPPLVGIYDHATFNNITEAKRALWTGGNGVISFLRSVENALDAFLFPSLREPRAQRFVARFDLSSIEALREDTTAKVQAAAEITARGVGLSMNESLALVGVEAEPPGRGGDRYRTLALEVVSDDGSTTSDPSSGAAEGSEGGSSPAAVGKPASAAPVSPDEIPAGGLSLNGAQISAVTNIVLAVAEGRLPRDSAVGLLMQLFGVTLEQAGDMLGSAGTGDETMPNRPAGGSATDEDGPPPESDEDDEPPAPTFESFRGMDHDTLGHQQLRELRTVDPAAWRTEYWRRFDKAVLQEGDASIKKAASKFLRSYRDAQIARLNAVARGAKNMRRRPALLDAEFKAATPNQIADALLLDLDEWVEKMAVQVGPKLAAVYEAALIDAVADIGGAQIGVAAPRVANALAAQQIKLTEGVASTLAKKVKRTLIKTLSTVEGVNIATVQQAVSSVLPELKGALKQAFTDVDSRALAIARTETGAAANTARFVHMDENDVDEHEWISSRDGEVRDMHSSPQGDGAVARVGEPFPNGLLYPHDPAATADQVVNCRCTTAAVIKVPPPESEG